MPRKNIVNSSKKENQIPRSLTSDVYNLKGNVVGKVALPAEIFSAEVKPELIAAAVRVYQANLRSGTHDTKTRSEVIGSTRKIYRQKGTGRARHGAITAPIFIGGGVAHGPHPRDYSLNLPQKMKRLALFGVLTGKLQDGSIKIVRGLEKIDLKTKNMNEALVNLKLANNNNKRKNVLLVTSGDFENVRLAGRNIEYLTIENAKLIYALEILSHKNLLLMEEAVPVLAGHFISKNKHKTENSKDLAVKKKTAVIKKKTKVSKRAESKK